MSAKYFVYAGGRWCELDTRTGRVSGFRARARFCFVRGQRLHAARSSAVLRALRAQAAGAPSAVRDAAPLPRCPRRRLRRLERSRSRRCSECRPSHAHCCARSHGRCDVNTNALQPTPPTPTAATSPRKQRRASSNEQEIRIVESVHKTPVKQIQVSPKKSPQKLVRHNRQASSDEIEKPAQKSVKRARQSSQQHVNVVVLDKNSKWSSSSDESEETVARGKASLMKSPQKQSKHKNSGDEEEKRKRVTRARVSSQVNGALRIRSTSTSSTSSDEAQKSAQGKPSPIKSPQKLRRHKNSGDEVEKRKRVTRARLSSQVNGALRIRSTSTSSSSDEAQKSARGKPSPTKSPQKLRRHNNSSDEEEKRKPVTRARLSSKVNGVEKNKSTSTSSTSSDEAQKSARSKPIKSPQKFRRHKNSGDDGKRKPVTRARLSSKVNGVERNKSTSSSTSSDEEDQKSKTTGKTSNQKEKIRNQRRSRRVLEISSDEDSEPAKPVTRSRAPTRPSRQDVIVVEDDSDDDQPVIKTKKAVKDLDSSSEETETKSQSRRKVSKAEKLTKRLLETTESDTGEESEQAGTGTERSVRCKELVICESDVETLRSFVKERGGRENLARFDNDERYKLRIFHRLNPLVSLQRYQPLESLLRQRLTIKEFAKNLGLRSVAEVTPEKRYRMRNSTKNARVPSDNEDKENVAKPKRRRLWNNDKSMLDSVRDSISSEAPKAKPQIIKPAVNRDSSGDSSDSDAEFKRKVREQLAKKKRTSLEGGVKANARSTEASRLLKENEKPNNSSSAKMAEMLRSSDDEPRQTRSNKIATPKGKPQKVTAVSENDKIKSAKVTDEQDDSEVRKTRSSIKPAESPTKSKQSGNDNVATTKVILTRNSVNSEWEVRNNTSNVEIPARTLKEQNKKDSSDTDSAFETSKSSPKKANMIRKGKAPGRITNLPNRKGKEDGSKRRDLDSAKAKENKTSAFVKSMTVKPVKFKKSSVANGREYTSLEDHAIVAWVCGGHQRERLVNGNRLWRELALDYKRLTGQDRSWHSLRNRYLRYVLPALGTLALPPAQVSRLRAAAAAGEIKSRGAKQRRNSIFTTPPVSSASTALRDRTGKNETQSEKEKSKTDDKEQKEKEVRKRSEPQTSGARGKGRIIKDAPTPKKDPASPAAPRVTRSSVGSPSKGNRK